MSTLLQIGVVAIAPMVLTWAASTSMLGLSRHVYVAGHEPAGAELAGQAQPAVDALHRDPDRRGDRVRARAPDRRAACSPRSTRSGQPSRSRSRTCRSCGSAGQSPTNERPYRIPFNVRVPGEGDCPMPALLGAVLMSLLWLAVHRLPRPRAVGRGRVDGVRPDRVRDLPQVRGGRPADQAGVGAGAGAAQGGAPEAEYGNILVPIFGTEARRRHRQHGGPARGRGR